VDLKGLTVTPIFKLEKDDARGIEEVIEEEDFTLLVIGARGRKAGAGVLLGSVTEHLINTTTIPLLAVKRKVQAWACLMRYSNCRAEWPRYLRRLYM